MTRTPRTWHNDGSQAPEGSVLVFGSSLSAQGLTDPQCYALPTKKANIAGPLSLDAIRLGVSAFLHHAATHPEDRFFVTRIGHKDVDIAPMFRDAPLNCSLPQAWREFIDPEVVCI